jgi:processive 1,2-diacylglycerol beta-glucosyltransferase
MRVLVLSASYGSGHNAAGDSVAVALGREGADVTVRDYFRDLVGPRFERLTRALYYRVLRHAPHAWAIGYALADRMSTDSPLAFGMTRVGMRALARLLAHDRPDAVVTVHATPAVVMSALVAEGHRVPPHTTVVTDFVAHGQWMAPHADRYCVPAPEVGHEFVARGLAPERVVVTGVPVAPAFDEPMEQAEARRQLGLPADAPVVLAMAGSDGGLGKLVAVTDVLGRLRHPVLGLVVAGRDARLATRLRGSVDGRFIHVLGWRPDIRRLMAAADVLVTKAGGMTIAEAIAAELPMVLHGSLPGQEKRNERFASRAGIALIARSARELARGLERALDEPAILERLRECSRRIRRAHAACSVARAVVADANAWVAERARSVTGDERAVRPAGADRTRRAARG